MLPHPEHSLLEARRMVQWIVGLAQNPVLPQVAQALSGQFPVGSESGCIVLEATYTDLGAGPAPALSARAQCIVRTARVEAEHYSECVGPQVLESRSAGGQRFVGAIDHGHYLRFERVELAGITGLRLNVSSAGSGGSVLLRSATLDGPIVARVQIEPNGAWEDWHSLEVELVPTAGLQDLYLCFESSSRAQALFNIDWLEFLVAKAEVPGSKDGSR